jgi:23S rRNA G2445 N2-methylase RlmL
VAAEATDFACRAHLFYAQTLPGVEKTAWQEIEAKLPGASLEGFRRVGDRNGIVLFEYRGNPQDLLRLRSTEDLFLLVGYAPSVPSDRTALVVVQEVIEQSRYLDVGLRTYREIKKPGANKRTRFKVVARKQGGGHSYRRIDVQRAVEQGVLRRYNRQWRVVEDDADVEIWLTLLHHEALCGLRLSPKTMRHREYKMRHLPASLRPTAAYAMVFLSDPQPSDVFLDPMCGAGTILIERALATRYRMLLGGDIDPGAIEVCLENIGPRYKPIQITRWDAAGLPLADHSVDKVVTNMPFGRQIGTREGNLVLYPRFFREMGRVVRTGGRIVILSGERQLVNECLAQRQELLLREESAVSILGAAATLYTIDRE